MGKDSKTDPDQNAGSPFAWPHLPEAFQVQAGAWLQEQADLLDSTQKMMAAWTRRRQESLEAVLEAAQKIGASKDLHQAFTAYSEWMTGSMERIRAEMNDTREEVLRLAEHGRKSFGAMPDKDDGVKPASEQASPAAETPKSNRDLTRKGAAE